ncbi:MAG: hypothetical protein WBE34_13085 [Candidatus Nitrosopolaris sp.]
MLLTTSIVVAIVSDSIPLAQAKRSVGHSTTKASKPGGFAPGSTGGGLQKNRQLGRSL